MSERCGHESPLRVDLKGQRFGNLVVLSYADYDRRGHARWNCCCDCGNEVVIPGRKMRHNGKKDCGCGMSRKSRLSAESPNVR